MSASRPSLYEQPWPDDGDEFRFFQLGHIVEDIVPAARKWATAFGVGPFHVLPVVDQYLQYSPDDERVVRVQVAVAQAGPVQIELIQQHCDTPSLYRDWSRNGASTLHQLATVTSAYDAKVAHLAELGYATVAESLRGPFRIAYVDTVDDFGFYSEIVELQPGFLDQLRTISTTCATWDGTDPVRILTRDGYRVPTNQ